MNLPAGKTCAECRFTRHCQAMYGKTAQDETCDFFPVRFLGKPAASEAAA
jgi:hypothetical protein